jgi:hypothetical protein
MHSWSGEAVKDCAYCSEECRQAAWVPYFFTQSYLPCQHYPYRAGKKKPVDRSTGKVLRRETAVSCPPSECTADKIILGRSRAFNHYKLVWFDAARDLKAA